MLLIMMRKVITKVESKKIIMSPVENVDDVIFDIKPVMVKPKGFISSEEIPELADPNIPSEKKNELITNYFSKINEECDIKNKEALANVKKKVFYEIDDSEVKTVLIEKSSTSNVVDNLLHKFGINKVPEPKQTQYVSKRQLVKCSNTGMLDAFALAFANHCPLVIEPHSLWILIMQSISKHVELNVEKYRGLFTDSTDKKTLVVEVNNDREFKKFIDGITSQLNKLITFDPLVDFSTSTPVSNYVAKATLMDMSKSYYDYCMKIMCGIPEFHVYGTLEDWNKFIAKAKELGTLFDLKKWTDTIVEVVTKIRDCDYKKDTYFWNYAYNLDHGCGGPPGVSGWFLAFILYDSGDTMRMWKMPSEKEQNDRFRDKVSIDIDEFKAQIVQVPFEQVDCLGNRKSMDLYAGFCGVYQDVDTGAFSPCIGWAIAE